MDGIINVNKPKGITSFDVVRKIRSLSREQKVGHTGTLDPLAEGVLPVCLGKATKLIDYIMGSRKVYKTVLKLGLESDTYDIEGKIIETRDVNSTEEEIKQVVEGFIGEIAQVPPMYSALKVNGKRLYELARQGIEIEREPRNITIYSIEILRIEVPYVELIVHCSKGTYIRSLCYDIGRKLGCGAIMVELTRLATGAFHITESIALEELTKENIPLHLHSLEKALVEFDIVTVDKKFEKLLVNGVNVMDRNLLSKVTDNKLYRIYNLEGLLLGIGSKKAESFKMLKLLT